MRLNVVLCVLAGLLGGRSVSAQANQHTKETLLIIPHTHWEGAVFKTREEYLDIGLTNILKALKLLQAHPNYRFTLDQVAYVKPFLERYPEAASAFRAMVKEGRLAIVGGTDVMHDNNMPGPESVVHQMLYGKRYYRDALGVDVTSGWALDTFGHNGQMPQILKLADDEVAGVFGGEFGALEVVLRGDVVFQRGDVDEIRGEEGAEVDDLEGADDGVEAGSLDTEGGEVDLLDLDAGGGVDGGKKRL